MLSFWMNQITFLSIFDLGLTSAVHAVDDQIIAKAHNADATDYNANNYRNGNGTACTIASITVAVAIAGTRLTGTAAAARTTSSFEFTPIRR